MPHQESLTVIAKVDGKRYAGLDKLLAQMAKDPGNNATLPFAKVSGLHFGRLLLLPESTDLEGKPIPPQLLMMSDCDGSADAHLERIVDVAGDGIDKVFGYCEGYPERPASREARIGFLNRNRVDVKATYVHRQGRTVEQIRGESELHRMLQDFISAQRWDGVPALEVRRRVRAHVKTHPKFGWALRKPSGVPLSFRARNALHFWTLPLGLIAFGPVVLPTVGLVLVLVRMQERRDPSEHIRPSAEHVQALTEIEDYYAHNGFSAGGYVKPGLVRQAVLRSVLPLIGWGTRHLFTRDSLAGVKTIHFARWVPLDGYRRVVFASNFDGSMESYNNDFIDLVAWGLNLVFSNGYGYPRTRWLLFGGAEREQEFKDYLRRHQIPTPVWYSAYPHLTAVNVERNAKLRAGLSRRRMNEREARQWLQLL